MDRPGPAFALPVASIARVVIVAIFWIAPGSRVDRWFRSTRT